MQTSSRTQQAEPWFDANKTKEGLILRIGGSWVCHTVSVLEPELQSFLQGDFPKNLFVI